MNLYRKLFYPLFLFIMLNACLQSRKNDTRNIFNLEGFIDNQVELLSRERPQLIKYTGIGNRTENLLLDPDSTGWQKELSIFKTADIQKPGLRDFYDKNLRDSADLEIEEYVLRDTSKTETRFLRIERGKMNGQVRSVRAEQQTGNPIYKSRRELYLQCLRTGDDHVLLDSFSVKGFQKMILQDTVFYFTSGKITGF